MTMAENESAALEAASEVATDAVAKLKLKIEEEVKKLPNPDETVTYTLKYPMLDAKPMDSADLRLRPVYTGDLRAQDKSEYSSTDATAVLISRLSGLDIKDVDRLHESDYRAIAGVIAGRLGKETGLAAMLLALASRPTGETA